MHLDEGLPQFLMALNFIDFKRLKRFSFRCIDSKHWIACESNVSATSVLFQSQAHHLGEFVIGLVMETPGLQWGWL